MVALEGGPAGGVYTGAIVVGIALILFCLYVTRSIEKASQAELRELSSHERQADEDMGE